MNALQCLLSRRSYHAHQLCAPAPAGAQLERILSTAMTAADHGSLRPWRFILIEGQAIAKLVQLLTVIWQRNHPEASAEQIAAGLAFIAQAPQIIAVAAKVKPEHPVPEIEQILAAGAACQNVLNALHAEGFGAIWYSGETCYSDEFKQLMGLAVEDALLGYLFTGTPIQVGERKRASVASHCFSWQGAGSLQPLQFC
ncbi:nitroreductase family protein [Balneatrix alpica]|uniref:nitroreductase family protein n=1 Tax=Balneatrix alpica TaxID=75684 RepID=UPI0027398C59|nr:nitroreductase [Balneatrix alpica]